MGATDAGNNAAYATISGAAIGQFLDQTQPAPALFGGSGAQYIDIRYTPNNTTTSSTTAPANLYGGAGTTTTPSAVTINMSIVGLANTPFTSPFSRVELYERSTTPGSPTAVSYKLLGTFSQGGVSVSPTSATIANTFTYTPTFPSTSTGPIPSDLLVVATDANGYAVAFIIPTITLNP